MARPEKPIDWDEVDKLLLYQHTGTQIAAAFNMTNQTFCLRFQEHYDIPFTDYRNMKWEQGKGHLLRKQFSKAIDDGNVPLLLRLGEKYLDQKNSIQTEQKILIEHVDTASSSSPQIQEETISGSSMASDIR